MKNVFVLFALVTSAFFASNANAEVTYICAGKDNEGKIAQISFIATSNDKVLVNDLEGDQHALDAARKTAKTIVFGDYEWDGYGGSIELILPVNFAYSENETAGFKVQFKKEIYSELGHVGSIRFVGQCRAN